MNLEQILDVEEIVVWCFKLGIFMMVLENWKKEHSSVTMHNDIALSYSIEIPLKYSSCTALLSLIIFYRVF